METITAKVDSMGRISLPAKFRYHFGIEAGDEVIVMISEEDDSIRISTRESALKRIRRKMKTRIPKGTSLASELIHERRREANHE